MKLILFNLNWSQNLEITLFNEFKYCFSGGWIIKSSSWLLMKKVLKEVSKKLDGKVSTKISKEKNYCKAEGYHQKYEQKKSLKYWK